MQKPCNNSEKVFSSISNGKYHIFEKFHFRFVPGFFSSLHFIFVSFYFQVWKANDQNHSVAVLLHVNNSLFFSFHSYIYINAEKFNRHFCIMCVHSCHRVFFFIKKISSVDCLFIFRAEELFLHAKYIQR